MQSITVFILLFAIITLPASAKLYQVVSLLSSGARNPVNQLYDGAVAKFQWGQITPVGLRQQENLGKSFRRQYIENNPLLSKSYTKGQFQLISHYSNRSIESGLANLYGLYPLGNGQKLIYVDRKYHIPPYSYTNDVDQQNYALPEGQLISIVKFSSGLIEQCPNADAEMQKNIRLQLADYSQMLLTYTPFLKKMAVMFNIDQSAMNFTKLCGLYDTVRADRYLGRALPSDFKNEDLANMQHLYNWYGHFARINNLAHAYNTFKFNKIIDSFDGRIKTVEGGVKWSTLSVDEVDLIAAHNDLNISSAKCIEEVFRKGSSSSLNCEGGSPFASSIVFELHSDNGKDFYVKVRNNGKYVYLCETAKIECSYNDWKVRVKKAVVANPDDICGKPKGVKPVTQ